MANTLTIEVPDDVYQEICEQAATTRLTPEQITTEWLIGSLKQLNEDPLIQLAGSIHTDITDLSERHDEYIGQAIYREMHNCDDE